MIVKCENTGGHQQRAHLRLQQRQPDVSQQGGEVTVPRVGIMAHPCQQRGHHGLLLRHINIIRLEQPLHLLHREQQELLAAHHIQKVFLTDGQMKRLRDQRRKRLKMLSEQP